MRGFALLTAAVAVAIGIGVGGVAIFGGTSTRQHISASAGPVCFEYFGSGATLYLSEKVLTVDARTDERALAKAYCSGSARQPTIYLTESLFRRGQLIETARGIFKSDDPHPVAVVDLAPYSRDALPGVLAMLNFGGDASSYGLFAAHDGRVSMVPLSNSRWASPPGALAGGNAAQHGEGIACHATSNGRLVVTQTIWLLDAPARYVNNPDGTQSMAPGTRVLIERQEWTLGGAPLHSVSQRIFPNVTSTYALAQGFGKVSCGTRP